MYKYFRSDHALPRLILHRFWFSEIHIFDCEKKYNPDYNNMQGNNSIEKFTNREEELNTLETIIMLLYFLQMVEGAPTENIVKQERIIVIDDPVSNLDDIMLNAVLERIGLLITRILDGDKYIRQLFILTHRKECTKKLRSFDDRLENEQNIGLWILKKRNGMSQAQIFLPAK